VRVALVTPPMGSLTQPALSLPSLAAVLRPAGHDVVQQDVGIAALDGVLTRDGVSALRERIERSQGDHADGPRPRGRRMHAEAALVIARHVAEQIDEAKAILRDPRRFFDAAQYCFAVDVVRLSLEVASFAYSPFWIQARGGDYGCPVTYSEVRRLALDGNADPFAGILEDRLMPALLTGGVDVVGISVTYVEQLVPAFRLAYLTKLISSRTRVVMGGAAIILAEPRLRAEPAAHEWVDAYVFGEGEAVLLSLLDALGGTSVALPRPRVHLAGDLAEELGCPWVDADERLDFDALPCPDYSGLNLDDYLSPEPVLMLSSARGCYHRRCAFCNFALSFAKALSQRSLPALAADIETLQRQFGVRHIFFADDCIPPKRCTAIGNAVRSLPEPLAWATNVRFEPQFTRPVLQDLRAGGCVSLIFGHESASQRVLDLMDKGTTSEAAKRIVADASRSEIAVHLMNFIGFPGESPAEAQQTVDYLVAARQQITSFGLVEYHVTEASPVERDPARFGVSGLRRANALELVPKYVFSSDEHAPKRTRTREFKRALGRLLQAYPYDDRFLDGPIGAHSLLYIAERQTTRFEVMFGPEARDPDAILRGRPALREGTIILRQGGGKVLYHPPSSAYAAVNRRHWAWVKMIDGHIALSSLMLQTCPAPGTRALRDVLREHAANVAAKALQLEASGVLRFDL